MDIDKSVKTFVENKFSSTNGIWITCKSIDLCPSLIPYAKINLKWISYLHIRVKTKRPLEENMGVNLWDNESGNGFIE